MFEERVDQPVGQIGNLSEVLCGRRGHRRDRAAALGVARRLELSGSPPGGADNRWRAAATWTCLTGNAQMALVWFTLFERTSDSRFLNAALKAIDLVKSAQPMTSAHPGIHGGIPGSDPIWGDYIRAAIPNWSAKFFIDALFKEARRPRRFFRRGAAASRGSRLTWRRQCPTFRPWRRCSRRVSSCWRRLRRRSSSA